MSEIAAIFLILYEDLLSSPLAHVVIVGNNQYHSAHIISPRF